MKKKTSIRKKVSSLTVRVALISVIVIGAVAIAGLFVLRLNTVNISSKLGETAAEDSRTALEAQSVDILKTQVADKVEMCGNIMWLASIPVEIIAAAATDILQNPQRYMPNPVPPPDPATSGTWTPMYRLFDGTALADVEEEIALLGNLPP